MLELLLASGLLLVHLPDRPDLNSWVRSLTSAQGTPCCEGSDAHPVDEPDWKVIDGHYQVFLEGDWRDVPDTAVVQGPNKYGRVLVWYVPFRKSDGSLISIYIRCFLPAAGT